MFHGISTIKHFRNYTKPSYLPNDKCLPNPTQIFSNPFFEKKSFLQKDDERHVVIVINLSIIDLTSIQ